MQIYFHRSTGRTLPRAMQPSVRPRISVLVLLLIFFPLTLAGAVQIPDTGQTLTYSSTGSIAWPVEGSRFHGQDAHFEGPQMAYRDNKDGTITDLVTGLMWSKAVDEVKLSLAEAKHQARKMDLGGHTDWRVPTIKELYSLMNFSGSTGMPGRTQGKPVNAVPYINTDYFDFKYGDTRRGERYIDAQWLSSTTYVHTTMNGSPTLFGVNFADGRIKGYGYGRKGPKGEKKFYVRYVRGHQDYGQNQYTDNGNGTVTDQSTNMIWAQADSQRAMTWEEALAYARNSRLGGYSDWRLPNAKELQYIVDYTRSPDTTHSPAIAQVFSATPVTNEAGQDDFGHYWTATTHLDGPRAGANAVTICFGRAMGQMRGKTMDVHGAGAQRSDPKTGGNMIGHGPQGDARHGRNFVRLVRGGEVTPRTAQPDQDTTRYPYVVRVDEGYEAISTGRGFSNQQGNPMGGGSRPQGSGPGQAGGFGGSQFRGPGQFKSPEQFNSPGQDMDGGGASAFINRLDRNHDGRVDRSEFDGPAMHFDRFDTDRDGYITGDEAPTGPPPGGRPPMQ